MRSKMTLALLIALPMLAQTTLPQLKDGWGQGSRLLRANDPRLFHPDPKFRMPKELYPKVRPSDDYQGVILIGEKVQDKAFLEFGVPNRKNYVCEVRTLLAKRSVSFFTSPDGVWFTLEGLRPGDLVGYLCINFLP